MLYQVMEYLGPHIQEEGVFRKCSNVKRKEELVARLEAGEVLYPGEEEITVHEAAAALKSLLGSLAEPLLTDSMFPAICILGHLKEEIRLQGVQLILLLLPQDRQRLIKVGVNGYYRLML